MTTDPNKDALREQIARVIDPHAWQQAGRYGYEGLDPATAQSYARSLAKADAILALPAIALLDEVEAVMRPFAEAADLFLSNAPPETMAMVAIEASEAFGARDILAKLQQARGDRG